MNDLKILIYNIRRAYIKALLTDSKDFRFEADGLDDKERKYISELLNMQFHINNGRTVFTAKITPENVRKLDQRLDSYISRFILDLCIESCFARLEGCVNQKIRPPNWVIAASKCLRAEKDSNKYKLLESVLKEYPELDDIDSFYEIYDRK